jgi:hypothetical protein
MLIGIQNSLGILYVYLQNQATFHGENSRKYEKAYRQYSLPFSQPQWSSPLLVPFACLFPYGLQSIPKT